MKRPHLRECLQDPAGMWRSAEQPGPSKARMQATGTKQHINNVLNKEKSHNLSLNNAELISKCEEIDDS